MKKIAENLSFFSYDKMDSIIHTFSYLSLYKYWKQKFTSPIQCLPSKLKVFSAIVSVNKFSNSGFTQNYKELVILFTYCEKYYYVFIFHNFSRKSQVMKKFIEFAYGMFLTLGFLNQCFFIYILSSVSKSSFQLVTAE